MALPLVNLENVDVVLDGTTILRDITWRFGVGENWAVLGGNGSGKSTLLRLIRGELWPAPGRGRREYALDGIRQTTAVGIAQAMPLVSPETHARCLQLESTRTVQQLVESGVDGGDYPGARLAAADRARARRAAQQAGVLPLWRRDIQRISTGELRRALIARALAGRPRVLVCDEICDGLDAWARKALLGLLEKLARAGTQLLFTTHREEELIPAISRRLTLAEGRLGTAGVRHRDESGRSSTRAPARHPDRMSARRSARSAAHSTFVRFRRASVFLDGRRVLRDLDWELRGGEHWAVLGPNGSGKSTFLKLIAGDVHPALGGGIQRFEFTPRNTLWELRKRIGLVSPGLQAGYREDLTGIEVIASGFFSSIGLMERPTRGQLRRARTLAWRLGFGPLAERNTLTLSYGEFRKILLARALVQEPELLLLDEPFDGLDAAARRDMAGALELAARGASLVVVTHHTADLPRCLSHLLRLERGRIIAQGPLPPARVSPEAP